MLLPRSSRPQNVCETKLYKTQTIFKPKELQAKSTFRYYLFLQYVPMKLFVFWIGMTTKVNEFFNIICFNRIQLPICGFEFICQNQLYSLGRKSSDISSCWGLLPTRGMCFLLSQSAEFAGKTKWKITAIVCPNVPLWFQAAPFLTN